MDQCNTLVEGFTAQVDTYNKYAKATVPSVMIWTFECEISLKTGKEECKDLQWQIKFDKDKQGITTGARCGIIRELGTSQGAQARCSPWSNCQAKVRGCRIANRNQIFCGACSKGATPSCVLREDKAAFTKQCDQDKQALKTWLQKKWDGELLKPLNNSADYGR